MLKIARGDFQAPPDAAPFSPRFCPTEALAERAPREVQKVV
jgi:hypothetical protein